MTVFTDIPSLLDLQQRDMEIDEIERRLSSFPKEYVRIEDGIKKEKAAAEAETRALQHLEIQRKDWEVQLRQWEEKQFKLKTQQTGIKKVDEYKAMEGEIAKAGESIDRLETEILELLDTLERTREHNKIQEEAHEKRLKAFREEEDTLHNREKMAAKTLEQKKEERGKLEANMKGVFFEAYRKLRSSKIRFPLLVKLEESRCTGCFLKASRQEIEEAKRERDPVFCENCGRMLFIEK
jgi:predicted  nucleic acid-binding Zn-ribbon protein